MWNCPCGLVRSKTTWGCLYKSFTSRFKFRLTSPFFLGIHFFWLLYFIFFGSQHVRKHLKPLQWVGQQSPPTRRPMFPHRHMHLQLPLKIFNFALVLLHFSLPAIAAIHGNLKGPPRKAPDTREGCSLKLCLLQHQWKDIPHLAALNLHLLIDTTVCQLDHSCKTQTPQLLRRQGQGRPLQQTTGIHTVIPHLAALNLHLLIDTTVANWITSYHTPGV